jgi:hypothetical protein
MDNEFTKGGRDLKVKMTVKVGEDEGARVALSPGCITNGKFFNLTA